MKYVCHLEGACSAVSHTAQEAARISVAARMPVDVWYDGRRIRVPPAPSRTAMVSAIADARAGLYAGDGEPPSPNQIANGPGCALAAQARIPFIDALAHPHCRPGDIPMAAIKDSAVHATLEIVPVRVAEDRTVRHLRARRNIPQLVVAADGHAPRRICFLDNDGNPHWRDAIRDDR